MATARLGEHAPTVELKLDSDRCVNVSLPRERLELLRRTGPTEMTVRGNVYREPLPADGEDIFLQVNGRTIGYGLCGDFFVYVRDDSREGSRSDRVQPDNALSLFEQEQERRASGEEERRRPR